MARYKFIYLLIDWLIDEHAGCAGKTVISLDNCAIPERLNTKSRYKKTPRLPLPYSTDVSKLKPKKLNEENENKKREKEIHKNVYTWRDGQNSTATRNSPGATAAGIFCSITQAAQ